MKINYGIVAYLPYCDSEGNIEILHFCGYEKPIQKEWIDHLREELLTDEEFGLTKIAKDLIIEEARPDIVLYYKRQIESQIEDE